jgi:hypothetical protein
MPRLQGARLHLDFFTTHPDYRHKLYERYLQDN